MELMDEVEVGDEKEGRRRRRREESRKKAGKFSTLYLTCGRKRRTKGGLYLYGKKTRLLFVYFTMSRPEEASAAFPRMPWYGIYITSLQHSLTLVLLLLIPTQVTS